MKSRWMFGLIVTAALGGCGRPPASEAAKATGAAKATATTRAASAEPERERGEKPTSRASADVAATSPSQTRGTPAAAGDAIVLTPRAIQGQEFQLAENYTGKTLQVTGIVDSVDRTDDGGSSVSLVTGTGVADFVTLPLDEKEAWARVAPGQEVTLLGTVATGGPLDYFVWNVTGAGTNPAPVLTPEALAAEFRRNGQVAFDRYQKRPIYLKGTVRDVTKNDYNLVFVTLESPEGFAVQATVGGDFGGIELRLKTGERFTALAVAESYDPVTKLLTFGARPLERSVPVEGVKYAAEVPTLESRLKADADAIRAAKADLEVSPQAMLADADGDRDAYYRKYGGKVIEVTGEIVGLRPVYDASTVSFQLKTDAADRPVAFTIIEPAPWAKYAVGQTVTIRGRTTDFLAKDPTLDHGVVVASEPPPSPRPAFTAKDLAAKAAEDPQAFAKEWSGKVVEVSGPLGTPPTAEDRTIHLDGGEYAVQGLLQADQFAERAGLLSAKEGTPVRLFGTVTYSAPDDFILLQDAWLLPTQTP